MAAIDRLMMSSDLTSSFTGVAGEIISGGFVVGSSGADDVVHGSGNTGGPTSLAYTDIVCWTNVTLANPQNTIGLAIKTTASGDECPVLTDGIFILEGGSSTVTPGYPIYVQYGNSFTDCPAISGTTVSYQAVGRALTGASAEMKYFVGVLRF